MNIVFAMPSSQEHRHRSGSFRRLIETSHLADCANNAVELAILNPERRDTSDNTTLCVRISYQYQVDDAKNGDLIEL